jgi:aspartate-semialdehyde dehydrogenase
VEFYKDFTIEQVRHILASSPGIVLMDNPRANQYPMPIVAYDRDEVFVGRLRPDLYVKKALNMWVVADNLRKGAATNAVQIAQIILNRFFK